MIHLLVGPDRHLVTHELARLLESYDPEPGRLNTTHFDKGADLGEIASAAATGGFFGSGRVIVADGLLGGVTATGKAKKADLEMINALLASVAPDNHLILVDADLQSIPASIKPPPSSQTFTGAAPRGSELTRWTQSEAKRLGGSIEPRAAQELLGRLFPNRWARAQNPPFDNPPDLATLARALETLLLYADDQPISLEDVETMISSESSDQMFAFTDSIFAGDTATSLRLLIEEDLDDDSAAKLLGYAGMQSELSLVVGNAGRNDNLAALGKELGGASEGRLSRLQKSAGATVAAAVSQDVAWADRRMKTGKIRGVQGQLFDLLIARAKRERGR